ELRLRLVARTCSLGPPRVWLPRDPRSVVRGHFLRELLSERARPRAPLAPGGRRAVPSPSGRGRRVSAHRRPGRAARARRPRVPHHVLHGAVPSGDPCREETRAAWARADAVLLGAVGDPSLDQAPRHLRPEFGLLALRAQLGVYANLRPVAVFPALVDRSPLKADRLEGVDVLIVR